MRAGAGKAVRQYQSYNRRRRMRRERDAAYATYSGCSPKCLHIGAENFAIHGWFNTDLDPRVPEIYYLDATDTFPFPSGSFDFIFSEHMIEHIPFSDGLRMLAECHRILKPGGVIRTATPNLRKILALIEDCDGSERYLRWAVEQFNLPKDPFPGAPVVINNFFRSWGHQFIYDPEMLRQTMQQTGFEEIVQCEVGASSHPALRGLERHGDRWSDWVNKFETMVFECTAPRTSQCRRESMERELPSPV